MIHSKKRTSLILMELIISLLFFSIISAFCTRIFVKAHIASNTQSALNKACIECQSALEIIISDNCEYKLLSNAYTEGYIDGNSFITPVNATDTLYVVIEKHNKISYVTVTYYDSNEVQIYKLSTKCMTGGGE